MQIDAKIAEGYVILCNNKAKEHIFTVRNLGPAVECPKCGSTALSRRGTSPSHAATGNHGSAEVAMPPQYVNAFVKSNKADYRDAEANGEAVPKQGRIH